MSFAAQEIGTNYDIGLATRPNPDGSTATINCQNNNKAQVPLSQVAYMLLTEEGDYEESTDLVRNCLLYTSPSPRD